MAVRDQLHTSITEPRSQLPGSVDLRRTKIHLRGSGSKQPAAAGWAAGRLRVVGGGLLLLPPPNLDLRGAGTRIHIRGAWSNQPAAGFPLDKK